MPAAGYTGMARGVAPPKLGPANRLAATPSPVPRAAVQDRVRPAVPAARPPAPARLTRGAMHAGANPSNLPLGPPSPRATTNAQVIRQVFAAQNPRAQGAILRGVAAGRADPQTARAVWQAVNSLPYDQRIRLQPYMSKGPSLLDRLGGVLSHAEALGAGLGAGVSSGVGAGGHTAGAAAIEPQIAAAGGAKALQGGLQFVKNAGSDVWNLPAGTVQGTYGLAKDVVTGHEGNAFHMLVDPYVQFFEHPGRTVFQHPVNTLMMALGPEAVAGRLAGGVARTGVLGDAAAQAASTARAPLHLGTIAGELSPITEARSYSPDVVTKAMQVARERYMRSKGRNPDIAQPAPRIMHPVLRQAFNIGVEAKLNRMADEMSAVRQMAGRAERAQALAAVRRAAPPKEVRGVVSHILQGIVRTPDTAVADLTHEINRLRAAQTGKRTVEEIQNRKQVRDLSSALQHPELLPKAFEAAAAIRPVVKAQDAYLVAKGLLDPEQAARRAVLPYALAHMGATYDPVHEAFSVPGFRTREVIPKTQDNTKLIAELGGQLGAHRQALSDARATLRREEARVGRNRVSPWQLERLRKAVAEAQTRVQNTADSLAEARKREPRAPVTVRYGNTRTLTTSEILDHIKANGVPDPAYVEHAMGKVNPFRFYSTYRLAPGQVGSHGFTGHAFKTGAYDHTFEGLAGQVASRAEAVTKASLHDKVVNRLGIKMPPEMRTQLIRQVFADARDGKRTLQSARDEAQLIRQGLFTRDEANRFARAALVDDHGNPVPNALELTPISTAPAHVLGQVKDLQHPNELNNLSGIELRALSHAIEDAQHSTSRNVTLIPSVAAKRFGEQFAKTDATMRGIGRITQQFRRTVLPYSTHWMTQIASEAGLRALLAGALDPRYLRDGRALMKRLQDTEQGRAALMEMVNATFYNAHDPLAVHNPNPGVIAGIAHALPPSRALIAAHNRYANTVGHAMYTLEHNARLMGLGKLAHQHMREFGGSWQDAVRLQGKTLDQLATRLKADPGLVAKFGRQIDETFGKYNKFSPKVRAAIQSYAPFLPWYLNAARYVLWTLPAHHPVASALLASLRQTVNQDVASGQQAPLNAYAMQELARISPFGIFTPPSTTPSPSAALGGQQALGALLPEAQGSLYNLAGVNSFGEGPLKGPHGDVKAQTGPAIAAAAENLLESFLPLARYARTIQEGGHPAYGTSTILSPQPETSKPGVSVADRIFNPFYSFERAKGSGPAYGPAAATASGGSWGAAPSSSSSGWGAASSSTAGWGAASSSTAGWGG